MNPREFYKYSWFSDLAYILWSDVDQIASKPQETLPSVLISAANAAQRIPGNAKTNDMDGLADKIFTPISRGGLGWKILDYHGNDATGLAASLFGDGQEKVLAIRGTETTGIEAQRDLLRADLQEIGGLGMAVSQVQHLPNQPPPGMSHAH